MELHFTTYRDDDEGELDVYVWGPIQEMKKCFGFVQEYPGDWGWVKRSYGLDDRTRPAPGFTPWSLDERADSASDWLIALIFHGVLPAENDDAFHTMVAEKRAPGAVAVHWNPLPRIGEMDFVRDER